ncbi:MAG: hypothetical protein KBA31_19315 [Alphaproteobacteria bacterium]|nr:hypothetical protein [Alphaproteobacteria bacterium]
MSVMWLRGFVCLASLAFSISVRAADVCAGDGTISVCVKSAALTPDRVDNLGVWSRVSLNLELTNKSEYPIDMILLADYNALSLSPESAEAIFNAFRPGENLRVSGLKTCYIERACREPKDGLTTIAPKVATRIHIDFSGKTLKAALPQLQLATKAGFNATLYVWERGKSRIIPIPVPEFPFANGHVR